jgi:hypothetical protein
MSSNNIKCNTTLKTKSSVPIPNLHLLPLLFMHCVHFKCIGECVFRWVMTCASHDRVLGLGTTSDFYFNFLGNMSCDFQWSDRGIYIHEFGWIMLEVDKITFIHPKCSNIISRFGSILVISSTLKLEICFWNFPLYRFWTTNRPKKKHDGYNYLIK